MDDVKKSKSYLIQVLLNIVAGPFGLFYSNLSAGIFLSGLCIVLAPMLGLGIYLTWAISPFIGAFCVYKYNSRGY